MQKAANGWGRRPLLPRVIPPQADTLSVSKISTKFPSDFCTPTDALRYISGVSQSWLHVQNINAIKHLTPNRHGITLC